MYEWLIGVYGIFVELEGEEEGYVYMKRDMFCGGSVKLVGKGERDVDFIYNFL